jgi:hypothetical protein
METLCQRRFYFRKSIGNLIQAVGGDNSLGILKKIAMSIARIESRRLEQNRVGILRGGFTHLRRKGKPLTDAVLVFWYHNSRIPSVSRRRGNLANGYLYKTLIKYYKQLIIRIIINIMKRLGKIQALRESNL